MIARLALHGYMVLLVGVLIAVALMDSDPELYAPPKLYWSRAAWWAFGILFLAQFFIRPKPDVRRRPPGT